MKKSLRFFCALCISINLSLFAHSTINLTIIDYAPTDFDYIMRLVTPEIKQVVILDCQSFFHELKFYNQTIEFKNLIFNFLLSSQECEDTAQLVVSKVDQGLGACLTYDMGIKRLTILDNLSFCD